MKKLLVFFTLFFYIYTFSWAQAPTGYYDEANGLTGAELKTALSDIISAHTSLSYSELWAAFQYTDKKPNGKVWDMYSDVPGGTPAYEFTFGTDQCGNYSSEGDCYNREHSFPKSWFNDGYPMYTDMFHLVPTDGYVNGKRSNYPYGEVGSASWTSTNGSKVGTSSYPGYSGTVFEPIDEYKGDFARGYFYMATRYESNISGWSCPMLNGTSYPAYTEWAVNLLMDWHEQDPVSQKEIDRNNKIYEDYQHNRNPFIDHPEYVNLIWGDGTTAIIFTSTPGTEVLANEQYTYNITASGGNGNPVTITCTEKPNWLTFTGGSNGSASLSGTPSESDEGIHSVVLTATDGEASVNQSFSIEVTVVVTEIIFSSTPITSAIANQQYSYTAQASVVGNPSASITFTATTVPAWLTLNDNSNGSAILYGTPTEAHIGNHNVVLLASTNGLSATQSFTISVSGGGSGGEFVETFTLMPESSSSYSNRSWTGDNDIEWSATSARTDQEIDGRAICLKHEGAPYLLSQTLLGGVSAITFEHQQKFSGSGGTITLFINDVQIGEPVEVTTEIGYASFDSINIGGNFTIKLVSDGATRIAIDNLGWTNLGSPPQPPVIGNISHSPENPYANDEVTFMAQVTDPDGSIQDVLLKYGNSSASLNQSTAMELVADDTYSVSLQLPLADGDVYYAIEAVDNDNNITVSPTFVVIPKKYEFTLTITITDGGVVEVDGMEYSSPITAEDGTDLTLQAIPNNDYKFDGWTGSLISTEANQTITILEDMEVTATFSPMNSIDNSNLGVVRVFPNPFSSSVSIEPPSQVNRVTFYSITGQPILMVSNPRGSINTNNIKSGLYLLKVEGSKGEIIFLKVVKE